MLLNRLCYWWNKNKILERLADCFSRFKRISFLDIKENWESIFCDIPIKFDEKRIKKILEKLVQQKIIRIDTAMSRHGENNVAKENDIEYVFLKSENQYNIHFYGKNL